MDRDIIDLFRKYLDRRCSANEMEQVIRLIESGEYHEEWETVLSEDAVRVQSEHVQSPMSRSERFRLRERIRQTIRTGQNNGDRQIVRLNWRWANISAVAAILLLTTAAVVHFYRDATLEPRLMNIGVTDDIAPGGNKAMLTLADGRKFHLSEGNQGIVTGAERLTYQDGSPISEGLSIDDMDGSPLLTVTTPPGGQYQISLSDGSKIWLNAASELTYPARFTDGSREVSLLGEAYFEIASDKNRPFIVSSRDQRVEVLGTKFNISAYHDDISTKTVVVSGSIRVGVSPNVIRPLDNVSTTGKAHHSAVLTSGHQSVVFDGDIKVEQVEPEDAVAWKNGYFMFNSERLVDVMTEIARWYDVSVEYEDASLKKETFFGSISRYKNISEILTLLEKTDIATFEIQNNKVVIKKQNKSLIN